MKYVTLTGERRLEALKRMNSKAVIRVPAAEGRWYVRAGAVLRRPLTNPKPRT